MPDSIGSERPIKPDRAGPTIAAEDWTGTWPVLRVAAAGTPITTNAYHGAVVGAGDALAEADRVNGAHWRAAKAGKAGYRPDTVPAIAALEPMTTVPAPVLTGAGLDIPAFLRRRPQSADRLAAWSCHRLWFGTRGQRGRLPTITGCGSAQASVAERPVVLPPVWPWRTL